MQILERFFLPARDEIWEQLAEELYGLFGETLDQLCRIGAATHDDPGLVI
jgi:hypothetical protein